MSPCYFKFWSIKIFGTNKVFNARLYLRLDFQFFKITLEPSSANNISENTQLLQNTCISIFITHHKQTLLVLNIIMLCWKQNHNTNFKQCNNSFSQLNISFNAYFTKCETAKTDGCRIKLGHKKKRL